MPEVEWRDIHDEIETATAPEEAAIAAYHACLAHADMAARTEAALSAAHSTHKLEVGGRRLCTVLRPRFISAERKQHLVDVSEVLTGMLERAGSILLQSDRLLNLVGASDMERELWLIDPGYEGFTLTSRLDAFMTNESIEFVEYNAESPAGIGFCDRLTEVFNELPAVQAWRGEEAEEQATACRHLLDTLLWAYRSWGAEGSPSIAIIDWDFVLTKRDFEICAEYFRSCGIPVVICDPRSLVYENGAVWHGNENITLVYRRVLLHELLDKADEVNQLLQAYRDGAICMVNSPRSKLLHKKSVLALLSDERLGLELSAPERKVVENTLPWTRLVETGCTQYGGEENDLISLLVSKQDQFALKPVDDYGGRGVVLGWDVTEEQWERAIDTALTSGYVAQQRVALPQELYPVWQRGRVQHIPMWLDSDPLLFRGAAGCILTRLSGSALLNVSAGSGSAAPTFTLHGKASS